MEALKKAVEHLNASLETVCKHYDSLKNEQGNLLFILFIKIFNNFLEKFFSKRSETVHAADSGTSYDYVTAKNEKCRYNMSESLTFVQESVAVMNRAMNEWEYNIPDPGTD